MSKWLPSGLGAEPKKVGILIGLLILAVPAYWYGNSSDAPVSSAPAPARVAPATRPAVPQPKAPRATARTGGRATDDFRPTLKLPEDFDLSKVDPTLRTDLLARVRSVADGGSSRSLFEFYTPPPPPPPKVDPIKPTPPKPVETAEVKPVEPPKPPPPPPPPPIPLKYSGYEGVPRGGGKLRAVFVDGDRHFLAAQNDVINNRYRVVRIGTTSAEVEDTVSKSTQTLTIATRCEDSSDPRCESK